ncbi:TonB-dependent receptor [Aliifodinibius salicampi]|uniref:TonB-dependent receptor n=1 Tax=Fodinibius salicampi TaxID=1920655 RepID=A0ABT3PZH9_9BACT|nr:TonB-dependent receptor [Fodinibius salicampi]MCW9713241.1 TonB-dependent receptor [Fodinibius salicampi]
MKIVQSLCLLYLGLIIVTPAKAQNSTTVRGKVLTQQGEPLAQAHLTIQDHSVHTVTNSNGEFAFTQQLPAGTYNLEISHIGYRTLHQTIEIDHSSRDTLTFKLRQKRYRSPSVVVTATRSRRDIEDVPEPVTVISDQEIQTSGSTRLSEILAEQTGLTLTSDHGTGIQVQGFASDYTKIMIDGQPLIGRTAGTLNLDRISVGNVQQVEMIKGPSSALWGSDALAGVINVITEKGSRPFELDVNSRYGSNQTGDIGIDLSAKKNGWKNNLFLNRNSSKGYRLRPDAISQTVPEYYNYTASYQTTVPLSDAIKVEYRGRYYRENQSSTDYLGSSENPTLLNGEALQEDYSLAPSLHVELGAGLSAELSHYYTRYRTNKRYHYQQGDSLYEHSTFDQSYNKSELQLTKRWNTEHISTIGSGFKHEQLKAQRYSDDPTFDSYFLFAQHEWTPSGKLDFIGGLRYDSHSEYASQLSPKLSARHKLFSWIHLRASLGSGFKAPDFRQLFLNFTNPTVGYTVVGSSNAKGRIEELQNQGQIEQILIPLDQLSKIQAEQSWAYNTGFDLFSTNNMELRVNLFYNDVSNLIESAPVATKNNGQSVYTYFNLEEIYTQGVETQLRWELSDQFEISASYQLLDARRKVEETQTVQDEDGEVIEKEFSSYEPMFNRSKHSANIKMYYFWEALNIDANIRGNWHGKYGRIDANGNSYVDPDEYEDGYMVWDASIAKTVNDRYTLRLGIDNIFDFMRPADLSHLPGRLFYGQLSLQLY